MPTFLLCFAAWACIALGMERHHEDAYGRAGNARRHTWLRRAGWALLLLSLWLATRPAQHTPASLGLVAWVVALSLAALACTAMATWQPRRMVPAAITALACALLWHAV